MNRRAFISGVAAVAGLRAGEPQRELLMPSDSADELGFRLMWYNPVSAIDQHSYRLAISGLIEKPQSLSIADLRRMPQETQSSRLKCVQCWSSRTQWGGLRFGYLMELAKPKKTAHAVRLDCADKWYEYFSLDQMLSPRLMLALDMAGKPLADRHGAPLRLIDPSRYGYKSAKLITAITFVEEGKGSMACDIGPYYTPGGEIQSGYDHPLDLGEKMRKKISGGEITEY
jgi:DMSO/TMAO reductase YedYZ molybdopterin-dependent catalytic subunit